MVWLGKGYRKYDMGMVSGLLHGARGGCGVLLSEGRWFNSPGLPVKVSLGKILNPKLLLTSVYECMYDLP